MSPEEKAALSARLRGGRAERRNLARPGHARHRGRVRQGRRRQVDPDGESGRVARRARRAGGCARRRRLRPLDPAHARRAPAPDRGRPDDRPARSWRSEADVDRLLPRRQQPRHVAWADAAQGARAVPLRRALGRARHARRRHAARHRRRRDLARELLPRAEVLVVTTPPPAARKWPYVRPRWPKSGDAVARRGREHVVARRLASGAVRLRRRRAAGRRDRCAAARPGAARSRPARGCRRRDAWAGGSARGGRCRGDRRARRGAPGDAARHDPQGPHRSGDQERGARAPARAWPR